ncbi:MAG: adenylate/guanylate cyclase domain-containing protein, partial [Chitinophagales bacterium]
EVFENCMAKFEGKLLQYYGDGTLSIFKSAANAVQSAIEMQTICRQEKVDLRIGIHSGDVMFDDTGIYGDSVNVASRIESLAVPGSVFISEKLFDEIRNQNIEAQPLGYFELKNVQQPMLVYAVSNPGIVVPSRDDVKGKVKQTLNAVAVLPFTSLSSDLENEFFCDGVTEELLNVLAKIDGLQVTSRTSSFAFKGKKEDIREIAGKLNVQKVLEGSVRKAGNKVRITAQLINASDGYHIWSETYERTIEDIFAVQDDIAREIANKFRINLSEAEHGKKLVKAPTENLEAYKRYIQALQLFDKADPVSRQRSIQLFNEAIALDPSFAYPHGWLASLYAFYGQIGAMPANKAAELTKYHASKAIAIDPENAMSLIALATIKFYIEWDWKEGMRLLEKAIDINPNDPMVFISRAEFRFVLLQFEEAIEDAQTAYKLDPLSVDIIATVARICVTTGHIEEAEKYCREAEILDSNNIMVSNMRGYITGFNGDWKKALEIFENVHKIAGDFPILLLAIAFAYSKLGDKAALQELFEKVLKLQQQQPETHFDFLLLAICMGLDDREQMGEYFARCVQKKLLWSILFYGTIFMKGLEHYEPVVNERKKLGLPVIE